MVHTTSRASPGRFEGRPIDDRGKRRTVARNHAGWPCIAAARRATIEDPFGHKWYVSTHFEDVPPDEIARRAAAMHGQPA